ncbi:MAG: hypothetical protein J0I41_21270 [Filimonas sp.]|nr:hypothetical protein [Filimonas sp.]
MMLLNRITTVQASVARDDTSSSTVVQMMHKIDLYARRVSSRGDKQVREDTNLGEVSASYI